MMDKTGASTQLLDNLEDIDDIGPTYAKGLAKIGVFRFEDLLNYAPDQLADQLRQVNVHVSAERIQTQQWHMQAKALYEKKKQAQSRAGKTEMTSHDQASFIVEFKYSVAPDGDKRWETTVAHNEAEGTANQSETFEGLDTQPWTSWIVEKAGLPVAQVEPPVAQATAVSEAVPEIAPKSIKPEIKLTLSPPALSVQTATASCPITLHVVQIKFALTGEGVDRLLAAQPPFLAKIESEEETEEKPRLLGCYEGQIIPGVSQYSCKLAFVPDKKIAGLRTTVSIMPIGDVSEFVESPVRETAVTTL